MQRIVHTKELPLADFIGGLNARIAGFKSLNSGTINEIFTILHGMLDPYMIKFSHDARGVLESIRGLQELHPTAKIPGRIRIVLKTRRNNADFRHELVRVCNGLVIVIEETDASLKCRTLAVPVKEVNQSLQNPSIEHYLKLGKYNIYPIKDGTVLNLYYDDAHAWEDNGEIRYGRWYYGSRNAFNVEGISWRGHQYRTVLDQLSACYPSFDLKRLDTKCTYTIGIRHPAFHPFNQPAEWTETSSFDDGKNWHKEMWLIEATHYTGDGVISPRNDDYKLPDIGIPIQTPITLELNMNTIRRYCAISLDVFLGTGVSNKRSTDSAPTADDLPPDCERFLTQASTVPPAQNAKPSKPIFLGYILRLKPSALLEEPNCVSQDIIIESRFWTEIRNMIYESPSTTARDKGNKAVHFRDVRYMVLHNYMNRTRLPYFLRILPQYSTLYTQQDRMVTCILDMIYESLSGTQPLKTDNEDVKSWRTSYASLADQLAPIIRKEYDVHRGPKVDKKVVATDKAMIRDLLVHLKYLDVFYEGMYPV